MKRKIDVLRPANGDENVRIVMVDGHEIDYTMTPAAANIVAAFLRANITPLERVLCNTSSD